MEVDKKLLMQLKRETGAGLSDCLKALKETNGDIEKAKIILRQKGYSVLEKRQDKEANQGYINAIIDEKKERGVIYMLSCETDFVARCEPFQKTAQEIDKIISKEFPESVEQLYDLKNEEGISVREMIIDLAGKVGERTEIKKYRYVRGPYLSHYVHYGNGMASIVVFNKRIDGFEETGQEIAIHVTAMRPKAINIEDLPSEIVEKEKQIFMEELSSIKDENIRNKAIEGKLRKVLADIVLMEQPFALDESITVREYLAEKGIDAKIIDFVRFALTD